jgi:DNA-binding transcriptional ArsR family regulator
MSQAGINLIYPFVIMMFLYSTDLGFILNSPRNSASFIFNHPVDLSHTAANTAAMTDTLTQVFAALADPTRRAILAMLLEDDMAVTDVAEPFAMSLAAISKHLQILAEAGLIAQEKRGRVKWCKLEPDALRAASVWMQGFGVFDPVDLDAFERFLADELSEPPA